MTGPRVGLIDNTVNISYVTTKMLRRAGIDADFVQQRGIPFNQQPLWEDGDLVERSDDEVLPTSSGYWEDREAELGWRRPDWVVRPSTALSKLPRIALRAARAVPAHLAPLGVAIATRELATIGAAADYDIVLALGPAAGQALLAGQPYAVIVTGWDVRELPFRTNAMEPAHRARAWLQRAALAHASALLVQPASDLVHLRRLGLDGRAIPFNIPVDIQTYEAIPPGTRSTVFGEEVAERSREKLLVFAPARIHFAIKRNDLLIEAFATVVRQAPVHLVMLGWGPDVARARAMVAELGIQRDVSFLPYVMSKVRLIKALRLADIVVDQYLYTAYGSLAREALACGRPLVSSYDPAEPQPHAPEDPAPILSARSASEIATGCLKLLDANERSRVGQAARTWTLRQNASALASLTEIVGMQARTPSS